MDRQDYISTYLNIAEKLNIHKAISFHCSQRTFATRFLTAGEAIEILQEVMGHESIKTTIISVCLSIFHLYA